MFGSPCAKGFAKLRQICPFKFVIVLKFTPTQSRMLQFFMPDWSLQNFIQVHFPNTLPVVRKTSAYREGLQVLVIARFGYQAEYVVSTRSVPLPDHKSAIYWFQPVPGGDYCGDPRPHISSQFPYLQIFHFFQFSQFLRPNFNFYR